MRLTTNMHLAGLTSLFWTIGVSFAYAAEKKLLVPLAGSDELPNLTTYIKDIYTWGVGAAALLAVLILVVGGFQYVLSAGNLGSTEAAKDRMKNAIFGMLILLGASLILSLVSTKLTDISLLSPAETEAKIGRAVTALNFDNLSESIKTKAGRNTVADSLNDLHEGIDKNLVSQPDYEATSQRLIDSFDNRYADPAFRQKIENTMRAAWQKVGDTPTPEQIEQRIARQRLEEFQSIVSRVKNPPQNITDKVKEYQKAVGGATTP